MISVADLKHHLRVEVTTDDAYLANLEAAAVAFIESETGAYFGRPAARTEYVTGAGTTTLWLPLAPILSDPVVDADVVVSERADPGDEGTDIVMAASDGFVVRGRRLLRKNGVWTYDYEYGVTYSGGYATGAEPEDIRMSVMQLVGLIYSAPGLAAGMKSEALGGYSYTRADMESLPLVQATIAAHGGGGALA